jgi:uncharacterized protein (TIGR02271 family)
MNRTNKFDETPLTTNGVGENLDKVDLYEEELSAEKHLRDAGEVRLNKRIVTTEKKITVPVMHEEITVERVPYAKPAHEPLRATASSFDEIRVPLCEEEVAAEKFTRALGEVRLHKRIVTTTKTITVPVMHEEIQVEHVKTDRKPIDYSETMFKETSHTIPLHDEEVEIRKYAVPREGVRVRKTSLQEERSATAELRREELDIERPKANGASWKKESVSPREFVETSQVIPLYEEEIEIRKYPVLREEVRVNRMALQEEQTASADTMKEELDIEEPEGLKRYHRTTT